MREEAEVEVLSYRAFCDRQTLEAWRRRRREYEYERDRGKSSRSDRYRGDQHASAPECVSTGSVYVLDRRLADLLSRPGSPAAWEES